ncbi:hypothetical protein DMUE_3688 [Dictyocoela muelleri]|nr:hypothetical protein DMUE_3688 [Dictyocoela muelleri]
MHNINHGKPEIISSKRGGKILLYNGYSYSVRNKNHTHIFWRCSNRKCSGSVVTLNNYTILSKKIYNHLQNFGENEALYTKEIIKQRSLITEKTPRNIFNFAIKNLSPEAIIKSNKYDNT